MTAQENLNHYEICIVNQTTITIQHRLQVYQNGSYVQNYIHSCQRSEINLEAMFQKHQ